MDRWIGGSVDRGIDGTLDRWFDRWIGGSVDRWIVRALY